MSDAEKKLIPRVEKVKITGGGDWLQIDFYDIDGLDSSFNLFSHRVGSFGNVTFNGITKEFAEQLCDKLQKVITNWEELSTLAADRLKKI